MSFYFKKWQPIQWTTSAKFFLDKGSFIDLKSTIISRWYNYSFLASTYIVRMHMVNNPYKVRNRITFFWEKKKMGSKKKGSN